MPILALALLCSSGCYTTARLWRDSHEQRVERTTLHALRATLADSRLGAGRLLLDAEPPAARAALAQCLASVPRPLVLDRIGDLREAGPTAAGPSSVEVAISVRKGISEATMRMEGLVPADRLLRARAGSAPAAERATARDGLARACWERGAVAVETQTAMMSRAAPVRLVGWRQRGVEVDDLQSLEQVLAAARDSFDPSAPRDLVMVAHDGHRLVEVPVAPMLWIDHLEPVREQAGMLRWRIDRKDYPRAPAGGEGSGATLPVHVAVSYVVDREVRHMPVLPTLGRIVATPVTLVIDAVGWTVTAPCWIGLLIIGPPQG